MEFSFKMNYDQKAMTAMAKAMRKVLQEEQDKKSKLIGWLFVVFAVIILLTSHNYDYRQIIAWVTVILFALYMVFQDYVNGFLALRKLPKGMRSGMWLFREDGYFSNTDMGESDFSYENIFAIVESEGYMLLVFQTGQAQIVELSAMQGGTVADFRRLLRKKTSLTIQTM